MAVFPADFGGIITFSTRLAPIRTCSIPILALFHMRYPTKLSFSKEIVALTRNMVELRVTLAVEIAREFGCEDPSYAAIGMS